MAAITAERMLDAARFAIIEEAGIAILTLIEGLEEEEFRHSRITRSEVRHQLAVISTTVESVSVDLWKRMPEMDWESWIVLSRELEGPNGDEAVWFGARSLTPVLLMWLRVYRRSEPTLFRFAG